MERRAILSVAATALLAGCSGVQERLPFGDGDESNDRVQEFGFGSAGFDKVEWVNLDVLRITFNEDHDMDGFGVMHEYTDRIEDAMYVDSAPRFSGPADFPLVDEIKNSGASYPNRTFKLVAYAGTFNGVAFADEKLGNVTFTVPETIMPPDSLEE